MKSSSFRASPAAEATHGAKKKKRTNWDKITYLSILTLIILLLARFVGYEALFVRGEGQMVAGVFDVRFSSDVQVVEFLQTKNRDVEPGTPLFRYVVIRDLEDVNSPDTEEERKWQEKELDHIDKMELKEVDIRKEREMLTYYRERLARIREGVYVGIYTVDKLESYERWVAESAAELASLNRETAVLQHRLQSLRDARMEVSSAPDPTRVYQTPVAGRITDIYQKEWATVTNSDRILSISMEESDKLFVRALFEKQDLKYVREQEVVSIEHANGAKSRGTIHRLFAPPANDALQAAQPFSAFTRYVLADIEPFSEEDLETWTRYKNLGATVTRRKDLRRFSE